MMNHKMLSLLSLCKKAGMLVSGEYSCEKALQNGEACLVIVCEDASDNTKKKFINKSFYYKVPAFVYGDREEISRAIGKQNRATIIVTEKSFAEKIKFLIEDANKEEGNKVCED